MSFAMKAVQRTAAASSQNLILLAPQVAPKTGAGLRFDSDSECGGDLLSKVQRFRGATYLKDGAISPKNLDAEGRYLVDSDSISWHVLSVDRDGDVCGCSRYTSYRNFVDFDSLSVGRSALAQSDRWGPKLRAAVDRERRTAASQDASFVEVGGWAISENLRGTTEALRIALATFALADCLGGCIGVTTATARHRSASILRKIGGRPLAIEDTELPRYFDPQYECEMEILRFDSTAPNPKFLPWIEQIKSEILTLPVLWGHYARHGKPRRTENARPDFGTGLQPAFGW
jgi:hypothetical protein